MNTLFSAPAGSPGAITRAALALALLFTLVACGTTSPAARTSVYDFGPGELTPPPTTLTRAPLALAEIEAPAALDSTAVLYRLAYAEAQQLRPYALARWSMTPAQLLRQRLRQQLGRQRAVLNPGDGLIAATTPGSPQAPRTLRLELEEFSQLFETPERSVGLLRLRATVLQAGPGGDQLLAQRSLLLQRPAPSADAAGGVHALTAATDAALQELEQWLLEWEP